MQANPSTAAKKTYGDYGLLDIGVPLILLGVCLAAIVWSADRGLDITDDGYYLVVARHPEEVQAWSSLWHSYESALFRLVHYQVPGLRLIGMVFPLLSGAILSLGVVRLLRALAP